MVLHIDRDYQRFREIVKGKIRKNLRKYMSYGELIVPRGKGVVSVPIPQIDIPHFRYDYRKMGGVGQGEGEPGTPVGYDQGEGDGRAGDQPGEHILEVEITFEELVEMLAEELELPRIRPKGKEDIYVERDKYTGIARVGPESLRHFRRTFREALKRHLIEGTYDFENPIIIPIRDDRRYRSWKVRMVPIAKAVIIYMMDVSGSMGPEQKEIVRQESFWIDLWIRHHYKRTETCYIVHDAVAREVDRDTFFRIREGGGTRISSAYKLGWEIIQERFPPEEWNIYVFQFSDGDNWDGGDTDFCVQMLRDHYLPHVNLFCYGQVKSAYGSGDFIYHLERHLEDYDNLILSRINSREEIYDSIKAFLGKGK